MNLRLVDSVAKIERDMQLALIADINTYLNKKKNIITDKLKRSARSWILAQPEMNSLKGSSMAYSLHSLFGIRSGNEMGIVEKIADAVVDSIEVKFSRVDKNFKGGLTFTIQPSDFQNLLGLPEGHVATQKGVDLHWLNWLLIEGDSVVVVGYQYDASGDGRSGVGRMVTGGSFRVPPSFSGTASNNFVTRAFINKQKEVEKILSEVLR